MKRAGLLGSVSALAAALLLRHDHGSTRKRGTGRRRIGVFYDTVRTEVRAAWNKARPPELPSRQQRRASQRLRAKTAAGKRWRDALPKRRNREAANG